MNSFFILYVNLNEMIWCMYVCLVLKTCFQVHYGRIWNSYASVYKGYCEITEFAIFALFKLDKFVNSPNAIFGQNLSLIMAGSCVCHFVISI